MRWYDYLCFAIAFYLVHRRGFKAGVKSKEHEFKWTCEPCKITFTSNRHDVVLRLADIHKESCKGS